VKVMNQIKAIEKWDIVERKWKIHWDEEIEEVDIDVGIKVQIGVIADIIEEIKARHEIAEIIRKQGKVEDDPGIW